MTFLMARSRGVPLKLLPVVVFSRNPLPHLICNVERRPLSPDDLPRCRIGVRSYMTTTAIWIRALLRSQFAARQWSRPCAPAVQCAAHSPTCGSMTANVRSYSRGRATRRRCSSIAPQGNTT
jgi:hypothetical protein